MGNGRVVCEADGPAWSGSCVRTSVKEIYYMLILKMLRRKNCWWYNFHVYFSLFLLFYLALYYWHVAKWGREGEEETASDLRNSPVIKIAIRRNFLLDQLWCHWPYDPSHAEKHPWKLQIAFFPFPFKSAITSAFSTKLVPDLVIYRCEFGWLFLKCSAKLDIIRLFC